MFPQKSRGVLWTFGAVTRQLKSSSKEANSSIPWTAQARVEVRQSQGKRQMPKLSGNLAFLLVMNRTSVYIYIGCVILLIDGTPIFDGESTLQLCYLEVRSRCALAAVSPSGQQGCCYRYRDHRKFFDGREVSENATDGHQVIIRVN